MSIFDNFFGKNKSVVTDQLTNYQSGRTSFSPGVTVRGMTPDYRYSPVVLTSLLDDLVVLRCITLITNLTVSNGYLVKSKFKYQEDAINSFVKSQSFDTISREILNSILGANGSMLCFFVLDEYNKKIVKRESMFWNNTQRVTASADEQSKKLTGFQVQTTTKQIIYNINPQDAHLINSINIANDYIGKTPLMHSAKIIQEKLTLANMNRVRGEMMNKIEGFISPKESLFKDLKGNDKLTYLASIGTVVDTIQSNSSNSTENYALLPPVDFVSIQSNNKDMEFIARIRQLNYEICDGFGVHPSLVGFDETTDPNLANGETQKDLFIISTVDHYKTLIENYWTWVIKNMFPEWEFNFFVGREQTDETIQIRDQLYQSIEAVKKLKEIGIEVEIDTSLLNKLGIKIKEQKTITGEVVNQEQIAIQDENDLNQVDILDEAEMKDKALAYLKLNPPSFERLDTRDFTKRIKTVINTQLDKFFENLNIANKSIESNDLLFQYIQENLPNIDITDKQLYSIMSETIIPDSVTMYNDFYNTNYTMQTLPTATKNQLLDLCNLTITGSGVYRGVDNTLAERIYGLYQKIAQNKKVTIDDYASVPDNVKKELWFDLKKNNQTILLQSRTDLISKIIANNSLNTVVATLAKEDKRGFVGVYTRNDSAVRDSHAVNEGKYFDTSLKQPWTDIKCRCTYIFGDENYLKSLNFIKL